MNLMNVHCEKVWNVNESLQFDNILSTMATVKALQCRAQPEGWLHWNGQHLAGWGFSESENNYCKNSV